MHKRPSFKEFKKKMLQNVECKAAYEALRPEFELFMQRIKARQKKCRTIKECMRMTRKKINC
jgi:hypothetical protein